MNKKVLKTMLALVIVFLCALYVLKIFFPEQFAMSVQNQTLINIGTYIDTHAWSYFAIQFVIGCLFDYMYFGAVCRRYKLHWSLFIIIVLYNIGFASFYTFGSAELIMNMSTIVVAISSCYMILTPMFYTRELRPLSIAYCVNYVAQTLSLNIRNLSLLMTNANSLIMILMSLECYLWMFLLLMLFNYDKKESKNMGACKPFYGKSKKYYEKKVAKLTAKNEKNNLVIAECKKAIEELEKNEKTQSK